MNKTFYITWLCKAGSLNREGAEQVEDLEEKKGKVEKGGGEREKEWLRREGRNPRNVFGPEAPVTTAGESHGGLFELLCGPEAPRWGRQTCCRWREAGRIMDRKYVEG